MVDEDFWYIMLIILIFQETLRVHRQGNQERNRRAVHLEREDGNHGSGSIKEKKESNGCQTVSI
jgi:hypothetical protein